MAPPVIGGVGVVRATHAVGRHHPAQAGGNLTSPRDPGATRVGAGFQLGNHPRVNPHVMLNEDQVAGMVPHGYKLGRIILVLVAGDQGHGVQLRQRPDRIERDAPLLLATAGSVGTEDQRISQSSHPALSESRYRRAGHARCRTYGGGSTGYPGSGQRRGYQSWRIRARGCIPTPSIAIRRQCP